MDWQIFVSGFILLFLTILAAYTSVLYNIALAETNTQIIVNAVILLFINDLDEQFMSVLQVLCPVWTNRQIAEIEQTVVKKCSIEYH